MNYSESDRQRLLNAAAEVVLATITADRTGVMAYFREMMAAGRFLYDAERRYANNALVSQLLAGTHEPEDPTSQERKPLPRERLLERITEIGEIVEDDAEAGSQAVPVRAGGTHRAGQRQGVHLPHKHGRAGVPARVAHAAAYARERRLT